MATAQARHHGTHRSRFKDHDLKTIGDRLNATLRKCLGWKTPTEVFCEKTMEEMGRDPYPQRQQELQFGYRSHTSPKNRRAASRILVRGGNVAA